MHPFQPGNCSFFGNLGQVAHAKHIECSFECIRVCRIEQVKLWISCDGNAFQYNHGSGDECKVIGDQKGILEEDFVQVIADS